MTLSIKPFFYYYFSMSPLSLPLLSQSSASAIPSVISSLGSFPLLDSSNSIIIIVKRKTIAKETYSNLHSGFQSKGILIQFECTYIFFYSITLNFKNSMASYVNSCYQCNISVYSWLPLEIKSNTSMMLMSFYILNEIVW